MAESSGDADSTARTSTDETGTSAAETGTSVAESAQPEPVVKRADEIDYESVDAADGLSKGVLLDASDGAPNFAVRRFRLAPGAAVPRHTNAVEHEQYVLAGEYTVVIDGEEHTVEAGDTLLIPAGTVHRYENTSEEPGLFLCVVPNGDDTIDIVE